MQTDFACSQLFPLIGEARLDAILVHGVDDMSTKDVFSYFNDFAPGSVEWIDDSSCKSLLTVNLAHQLPHSSK